jgi:hypothetical protein
VHELLSSLLGCGQALRPMCCYLATAAAVCRFFIKKRCIFVIRVVDFATVCPYHPALNIVGVQ